MKHKLFFGMIGGMIFSFFLIMESPSTPQPSELQLRRYAVAYLFYKYGLNMMFEKPLRIVNDQLLVIPHKDEPHIAIPLQKFNYFYVKNFPTEERNFLIVDLREEEPPSSNILIPDSATSLIGGAKIFIYTGNFNKDFENGARFYNALLEDRHITYAELAAAIHRKPYFFNSLEEAFRVIEQVFEYIKQCKGGVHMVDGGFQLCPGGDLPRIIYFNKIPSVDVIDFLSNTPKIDKAALDTTLKNNLFLSIGRQEGERYNAVNNGDSTFLNRIYPLPREQAEQVYKLMDALIFMATY